jgi:AcrR family transcriptional regulator
MARPRVARGSLSTDVIVDATLELIRTDPGEPITMERVADALGSRPMSLYTHVRGRDDLMALAAERVWLDWECAVPEGAAWDAQLTAWCASLADHVRRYRPLVMELTGAGAFPKALMHEIASLVGILRAAGLDGVDLAAVVRWIPQTVLGAVVLELARPPGMRGADGEAAAIVAAMGGLDDDDRAVLAGLLGDMTSPDLPDLADYTVARIVDGVRAVAAGA